MLCIALLGFSQNLNSQTIYALSGSKLVSFSATAPGTILSSAGISGTAAGQDIAGLDSRPNTGELYALGYNQTTGETQLYTLNLSTGTATAIGTAITLRTNLGKVSMDFNPTVDRIRVTGSTGSTSHECYLNLFSCTVANAPSQAPAVGPKVPATMIATH